MLNEILRDGLAMDYHVNTDRIRNLGSFDPLPQYKIYPGARTIQLPRPTQEDNDAFVRLLLGRKSRRDFSQQGISQDQLGQLLSLSFGISHSGYDGMLFRTYASAGGRFPIEVYPVVLRSEDLEPGIYHYNVLDNSLELIRPGQFETELNGFYANQPFQNVPCYILFSMVFERTMQKYGERGYRFLYLDAGHMGQNLYLVAEHLGLGAVAIGGGNASDTVIDSLLHINRSEESFFYGFAVGTPEETP